ncbi:chlorophyllase [Trifolium repens]|nr:chlorophyllase [Trifolium repens]
MVSSITNVFETGKYTTQLLRIDSCSHTQDVPPPKSLLIATPIEGGKFPLLLFIHGYLLYNSFYSQLIQHVASHGFIVIAPQVSSRLTF